MKNDESDKVEGEGSYSATRKYNQHVADSIERGDIESGAEEALAAIQGSEGKELKHAEELAKKGPKPSSTASARKTNSPG